jgi:hypothetical protein
MSDFRWIVEWMHGDDWKPFAGANHDYHAQVFCDYAKQNGLVARLRDTRLDAPNVETPTAPLDADAVRAIVRNMLDAHGRDAREDVRFTVRTALDEVRMRLIQLRGYHANSIRVEDMDGALLKAIDAMADPK